MKKSIKERHTERSLSEVFTLKGVNIVILASNYNPSIVSKEWLYQKNIIKETVANFIHTPPLSLVETERISFVLDEDSLRISLKTISPEGIEALPEIATKFVSCLPETPFKAVGFNYGYHIAKESSRLEALFSPNSDKLEELFSRSYKIGAVVTFPFERFIVSMRALPSREEAVTIPVDFNFHSDCQNAKAVKEILGLHPQTVRKAEEILRGLSK